MFNGKAGDWMDSIPNLGYCWDIYVDGGAQRSFVWNDKP